tara:strand:- start:7224 stop:7547 length:324 start_codon:yes stop_codon:yes gene_type:complete
MGQFGKIPSLEQLPGKDILLSYTQEGWYLMNKARSIKSTIPRKKKQYPMPQKFGELLTQNTLENSGYTNLSPSQKTEYLEWISEAKTDTTQDKRTTEAIEWLEEGKP